MALNPYRRLPPRSFWRSGVVGRAPSTIERPWTPKFEIGDDSPVATFGSCFAQHVGPALDSRGYTWLVTEEPPYGLSIESAKAFHYGLLSCRTGNVYTTSLLRQWTSWAAGEARPPSEVWDGPDGCFDPFRPTIEPGGFACPSELRRSREAAISAFREAIERAGVLVFTLGLTESWFDRKAGHEFPMCPGTVAGVFDDNAHLFVNQDVDAVRSALSDAVRLMRGLNPGLRIVLSVSPVPLAATATAGHVLVATSYSKAVLRAVAGKLADADPLIDYFPAYEIVCSPPFGGALFAPDQRSVTHDGVRCVMDHFFGAPQGPVGAVPAASGFDDAQRTADAVCDEELLGAFGSET